MFLSSPVWLTISLTLWLLLVVFRYKEIDNTIQKVLLSTGTGPYLVTMLILWLGICLIEERLILTVIGIPLRSHGEH